MVNGAEMLSSMKSKAYIIRVVWGHMKNVGFHMTPNDPKSPDVHLCHRKATKDT